MTTDEKKLAEAREKAFDESLSDSEREKARVASRPPEGYAWQTTIDGTKLVKIAQEQK